MQNEINIPADAAADSLRATIIRELDELTDDQLEEFVRLISALRRGEH